MYIVILTEIGIPDAKFQCGNANGKKQNGIGVHNFVISKIGFSPFFLFLILVHCERNICALC